MANQGDTLSPSIEKLSKHPTTGKHCESTTLENGESEELELAHQRPGLVEDLALDGLDPIYRAKVHSLNQAMQEIGMGRYQWFLFCLTGFGWMVDQMWETCVSVILPEIIMEFDPRYPELLSIGQQVGLVVGATLWSLSSDVIGRRLAFNMTLAIASIFSTAAAGAPNFVGLDSLLAVAGTGIGGNLPVDSAIFIEFCPASHQWLLTVMCIWWSFGQVLTALVAWPLIVNFSCPSSTPPGHCPRSENMGWRYLMIILGVVTIAMFVCRTFLFKLFESPKFYLAQGQDQRALDVVFAIAKYNGAPAPDLSREKLQHIENATRTSLSLEEPPRPGTTRPSTWMMVKSSLRQINGAHLRELFKNRKMAFSTTSIVLIWGMIGMGYNLFNVFLPIYLETHATGAVGTKNSLNTTYSHYAITYVCGIPGALFGGWLVQQRRIGRKGTLALSTIVTGIFLFCYSQATTQSASLGFTCAIAVTQNLMYGVLYAYTPEVFPGPHRGTGIGLASAFNRICNTMVPIIATFVNLKSSAPMWISGALMILAGILAMFLPYEPNGKSSV